jgi:hypothetical protein
MWNVLRNISRPDDGSLKNPIERDPKRQPGGNTTRNDGCESLADASDFLF